MEGSSPKSANPTRQIRQHLAALRAAGIDWLPRLEAPTLPPPQAPSDEPTQVAVVADEPTQDEVAPMPSLYSDSESVAPIEERRRELTVLAGEVAKCTKCNELASTRTQTVFGVGAINPDLCFVGEAPGADEDAQGEPFVGAAGQLLNKIINACGMKREEVYICNILKCRPPGNRTPLPNEAANCRGFFEKQIELIRPKFICALGACAAQNLLQTSLSIGKLRGKFQDFNGIPVLCTYHPAYLLRSPDKKREVWNDMKVLLERMGRPIPETKK